MFIVNPQTQGVLTLKPDMKVKSYGKNTIISWSRSTFVHDKVKKINFIINKQYDDLIQDFKSDKTFIISQWKEFPHKN